MKKLEFLGFDDTGREYVGHFTRKLEDGTSEIYSVGPLKPGEVGEFDDADAAKTLKGFEKAGNMAKDKKTGAPTGEAGPAFRAVK